MWLFKMAPGWRYDDVLTLKLIEKWDFINFDKWLEFEEMWTTQSKVILSTEMMEIKEIMKLEVNK